MAFGQKDFQKHTGVLQTRKVPIPEFGDDVAIVRGMTSKEAELFGAGYNSANPDGLTQARAIARALVDEGGLSVFDDVEAGAATLGEIPAGIVIRLMEALNEASGIGNSKAEQASIDADIAGESEAQTAS